MDGFLALAEWRAPLVEWSIVLPDAGIASPRALNLVRPMRPRELDVTGRAAHTHQLNVARTHWAFAVINDSELIGVGRDIHDQPSQPHIARFATSTLG